MPIETDLVVEDGTGLSDANTYVSLAECASYHDLQGNTLWASATESDQVVAVVRATSYMQTRWTFTGKPVQATQALSFPKAWSFKDKQGADVSGTVPTEIKQATMEYALAVLGTGTLVDLAPALDQSDPRTITYKREKTGPMEEETRYAGSGQKVRLSYPTADSIVKASGFASNSRGRSIR
jgi:hypothetical protein